MKRELDVARRMRAVPEISQALGLALAGEIRRAGHMVDDYGSKHEDAEVALFAQRELAGMRGSSGQLEEAARGASECAGAAIRLWGAADERTLIMRNTELYWTGRAGLQAKAEELADVLMTDAEVTLGIRDQLTSAIRNNSARIFEEGANPERARTIYLNLLADFDDSRNPQSEEALTSRRNYAEFLCSHQEYDESLDVYRHLLLQITELWGPLSEQALSTRHEAAQVSLLAGDPETATEQWRALYRDCETVVGLYHPLTIEVLNHLAAVAVAVDDYPAVVSWLSLVVKALDGRGNPETLAEVVRLKNRYAGLAVGELGGGAAE